MDSSILDIVIAVFSMMAGLIILSLSQSLSGESMKRVRIRGLLIHMYWIAKKCFGISFEQFARKTMYVFGVICILGSILMLGEAVYQLIM
ncbi:hypothetical protein M3690_14420 [Priestia megaterium]|uniref:hypothetical protein n=1 Tax=Priestia TaxID=2800373 RepID=UPI001E5437B8|nr:MULTISPECIES: hypothetical protein [Priestia]MCM3794489.1 hypothetical protein [Priestia megaterium]